MSRQILLGANRSRPLTVVEIDFHPIARRRGDVSAAPFAAGDNAAVSGRSEDGRFSTSVVGLDGDEFGRCGDRDVIESQYAIGVRVGQHVARYFHTIDK